MTYQTHSYSAFDSGTYSSKRSTVLTDRLQVSSLSEISIHPSQFSSSAEVAFLSRQIHTPFTESLNYRHETWPTIEEKEKRNTKISPPHINQCRLIFQGRHHLNQFPKFNPNRSRKSQDGFHQNCSNHISN
uniref:Uncharacterized protein n=1 Tax=Cucumis sativus TaxID=3659 RepID=A0A0A0LPB9_CUCSA